MDVVMAIAGVWNQTLTWSACRPSITRALQQGAAVLSQIDRVAVLGFIQNASQTSMFHILTLYVALLSILESKVFFLEILFCTTDLFSHSVGW